MEITEAYEKRFLSIPGKSQIDISDKAIVKYIGYYWTDFGKYEKTECEFVGEVVCVKVTNYTCIGIYIKPLYKKSGASWEKFTEYEEPTSKYFVYPHLLILPDKVASFGIHNLNTISEYNIPI